MKKNILKLKEIIVRDKLDIIFSIVVGFLIVAIYTFLNFSYVYSMNVEKDLSDNVIRFHVLANSDSDEDQQLKIYVKDKVLEKYRDDLILNESVEDAKNFFTENLEDIENYAQNLVYSKGYDYNVTCVLEKVQFPTKEYNDIKLPAGEYQAFRILIGEHEGKNFWCVLYPPLCYVDAVDSVEFSKAKTKLENSLSEDEFLLVSNQSSNTVSVKFKIVELWNSK